ncbi:MAG: NAD-dependent epimerase/dehydratase family protein [Acidobacteria bacterium]|nr:NAD-dependent epimerase/dehydratase family protein [Acidobacteriota bacterium]
MRILITGVCGFVGSQLAEYFLREGLLVAGVDNLMRPGSEINRNRLREAGVEFVHGDIRCASDVAALPKVDWVVDAAANTSVLAGLHGSAASAQLVEHNLFSLVHILEYCKRHNAGLFVLSSSRVYSIAALASLPMRDNGEAFLLDDTSTALPAGVSGRGIARDFSTAAPVSLHGATKLAGEVLALEYGSAFGFPVWVNRCGILAGAGQFGTPDQGIFSYWVNACLRHRPRRYIGWDGMGKQVRDALHPHDLARLLLIQAKIPGSGGERIYTVGGGPANAMSLRQLEAWCQYRFHTTDAPTAADEPRRYDIPWAVMDHTEATADFGSWTPSIALTQILEEIAQHAEAHPHWLEWSGLH